MPLAAELRQQIHAALEKTDGHRRQAALMLGMSEKDFNAKLYTDAELRLRWVGDAKTGRPKGERQEPPTKAITLHRPVVVEPQDQQATEDRHAAEAIAAEDQLVRQGIAALGVNGQALD